MAISPSVFSRPSRPPRQSAGTFAAGSRRRSWSPPKGGPLHSTASFDLRVEDHPDPVLELRRLVRLRRAYLRLNEGDQLLASQDVAGALAAYEAAMQISGEGTAHGEPEFWTAMTLASSQRVAEAETYLRRAGALSDRWARLVPRLVAPGLLPDDPALIERLVRAATPR